MIRKLKLLIIAIFFWGKTSKAKEENTRHASKVRTIIYFVLSFLVGVLYYKMSQVSVIYNQIQIDTLRGSYDSSGISADTIDCIEIFNTFRSDMNYNNDFIRTNNEVANCYKSGGIKFQILSHNNEPYIIKDNPHLDEDALLTLEMPAKEVEQVYYLGCIMTSFPSIIPIFPLFDYSSDWDKVLDFHFKFGIHTLGTKNYQLSYNNTHEDIPIDSVGSLHLLPGLVFEEYSIRENNKNRNEDYCLFDLGAKSSISNALNIFTTADISQYTHLLNINSDCHVNRVSVEYDVPIEIYSSIDSDLHLRPTGFDITGELLELLIDNNNILPIHVKLPTLENLQLIRSFVLTTLLTALVTLFFRNLYFLSRKWAVGYRRKNYLSFSKAKLISAKRVKRFRQSMYFLFGVIVIIALYYCYLIAHDSPVYIHDSRILLLIVCALLIFAIIAYAMYSYATTAVQKKDVEGDEKKEDELDTPITFFIHEKNEEEEWNNMVKDLRDEIKRKKQHTNSEKTDKKE